MVQASLEMLEGEPPLKLADLLLPARYPSVRKAPETADVANHLPSLRHMNGYHLGACDQRFCGLPHPSRRQGRLVQRERARGLMLSRVSSQFTILRPPNGDRPGLAS